jgi:hypothetical protein
MSRNIIGFLSDEKLKASFPKDAVVLVDTPKPIVYFHHEPECITEQVAYILANWQKFDVIYTWNQEIFDKCPNARLYHFCSSWISEEVFRNVDISKKKFAISTLCGSKVYPRASGHILRINLFYNQPYFTSRFPLVIFRSEQQKPVLPDINNNPLLTAVHAGKVRLFEEFQFCIVIENEKTTNNFTEKLIDCLIMKTLPIYYGCPNVSAFFDTRGWIEFDELEDLYVKLQTLNETHYAKFTDSIEKNYQKAISLRDYYTNIENAISH